MEYALFAVVIFFEVVLAGLVIWGFAKKEQEFIKFEKKIAKTIKSNIKVKRRMINARIRAKKESQVVFNRSVNRQYRKIRADATREEAENIG